MLFGRSSPPPAPNIPPISTEVHSRLLYFGLDEEKTKDLLSADDTGWTATSAFIEETRQGFPDTVLVEGLWLQDEHCAEGASEFDDENTRALISLGTIFGREKCVEYDSEHAASLFYRNQACRNGRNEYEENTPQTIAWQPKCMVILIEAESRAALRDQLVEAGRILVQPLRVNVSYVTSMSEDPDLQVAATNCALGRDLLDLYEHDLAGQAERDLLLKLQRDLTAAKRQHELYGRVYQGLSAYRPPLTPPPPSAPPALANAPPAAPKVISLGERYLQLQQRVEDLEKQVVDAAAAISVCVPSKTKTCGRSSLLAPNPWVSDDGRACAGNGTYEALEGFFCAYWGSEVNCTADSCSPPLSLTLRPLLPAAKPRRRRKLRSRRIALGFPSLLLLQRWGGPQVPGLRGEDHPQRRV